MNFSTPTQLPRPMKYLAGALGAGSILGVAYAFLGNSGAMLIVAAGVIFVALLLAAYVLFLGWMRKRKANPLSQGLAGNAASAPQGISEPARRARLDDLRRNFEQGVEKFRAAGKNLYSVPWYVLVGEPGSGKTEAIRHCNVGFPPGLQDQLQGAGGTLNMNWWFTNQAIILDTAGRLMFEEVPPGSTNEWAEFLKLLKQNRPNSPLNGMVLVIPVDTLIKDSADQIEKKASKIAQQFDQIQRTLGVRFPVFVIITKCDLLNGFREFFDDLNDPQLQHQIMGWSNPAALDERFDPVSVTNHLETVKQRLTDRRQHLLLDPVNSEDPQSRRADQVDALYALPDSITKIAPRLKRYLEMIFVAGEWSPKPLFLRGIYFTSSMTEGSALDAELAEVLGVPVDSLPEGRVWRRDRAYFLRDLFVEKVFREKGLVTRATNADKQLRTRRTVILSSGFIAVLLLLLMTWLGSRQLEQRIGSHRDFWVTAAEFTELKILSKKKYAGDPDIRIHGNVTNVAGFFGNNLPLVQAPLDIPLMFRPLTAFMGNVDTERHTAYRALFEKAVLQPVYAGARTTIASADTPWSPAATAALAQLMKTELAAAGGKPPADAHPQVELDPLFKLVLSDDDFTKYSGDSDKLQKVVDWVYTGASGGEKAWPPALVQPGSPVALAAIDQGIKSAKKYWDTQATDGEQMKPIIELRDALTDFQKKEDALLATHAEGSNVETLATYKTFAENWSATLAQLTGARNRAAAAWAVVAKGKPDNTTLEALYKAEFQRINAEARKSYEQLLQYTTESPADPAKNNGSATSLAAARANLQTYLKDLDNKDNAAKDEFAKYAALDASLLSLIKGADNNLHHRFEVLAQMYELADTFIVKKTDPAPDTSLTDAFAKADERAAKAVDQIRPLLIQSGGAQDRLSKAGALSQFAIYASTRCIKFCSARDTLAALPTNPEKWPDFVKDLAAKQKKNLARPNVPLVTFAEKTFAPTFAPDAVGAVNEDLDAIRRAAADASGKILEVTNLTAAAAAVKKTFDPYLATYIHYWREDVKDELKPAPKSFAEFSDTLGTMGGKAVTAALDEYGKAMIYALNKVGAADDETSVKLSAQFGTRPAFVAECSEVLSAWRSFGADSRQIRSAILAMEPVKFVETYTVLTAKTNDGFAAFYWQSLPKAGIDALAKDGLKDIREGLAELANYERFPLAPAGDKKDDLTLAEVLKARTALEKVRGAAAAAPAAGAPAGLGARTIGQGGVTRDKEMDTLLDALRGTNLLKDKQAYFEKLEKFFVALPTENKPLTVPLSINKEKLKDDNSVSFRYSYLVMAQGGKDLREAALNSTIPDVAIVEYPGGDITLQFREVPKGPILQTETFSGLWSPFRMIKSPNVKSIIHEGNKWTLEYAVTTPDKKTYALYIVLDFKVPIPDARDWPVPPPRTR